MNHNHQPQSCPCGRVLVVDDDAAVCEVLIHFLEQENFEVRTEHDGPSALNAFDTEHFDIILVDLHMPGMSGLEMAAIVRQRNLVIPIALITAMASALDPEAVIRVGISQVFAKPFDLQDLATWL